MNYNEIVGKLCRIAAELNEAEDVKHFQQLNTCIIALDELRDKIQLEVTKAQKLLVGNDN